jgi:ATP-dependent HslUV protease subunit HslV
MIQPFPIKKIKRVADCYIGGCGTLHVFEAFLKWYSGDKDIQPDMQSFKAIEMDAKGNVNIYEGDDKGNISAIPQGKIGAVGSGQNFAMGAMLAGASAEEAVKIAIKLDPYSGGKLKKVYAGC